MDVKHRSVVQEFIEVFNSNVAIQTLVSDPEMLLQALDELNKTIGLEKAKREIIRQLTHIIETKSSNYAPREGFHTIIRGPPGTGKTRLGKILSKIWVATGHLSMKTTEKRNSSLRSRDKAMFLMDTSDLAEPVKSVMSDLCKDVGDLADLLKVDEERTHFEIFSRPDFVAEYVGQSGPKTRKLLQKNVGKVIFVDEAYGLCRSINDSYGMESLIEINRFMSERPEDSIIIFAGYKDALERTVFISQRGLQRRFKWVFDIDGYTAEELGQIFALQIKSRGWKIDAGLDVGKFFGDNRDGFENYGGDTDNLATQCGLAISSERFEERINGKDPPEDYILTEKALNDAYKAHMQNRVKTKSAAISTMFC